MAIWKLVHLLGAVFLIGNIIVTGLWKVRADRLRDPRVSAFAAREVMLEDLLFTLPGTLMVMFGGYKLLAGRGVDWLFSGQAPLWMFWPSVFFSLSGIIWIAFLIPLQLRMIRWSTQGVEAGILGDAYHKASRTWVVLGILATVLPLASLALMVLKP